MSALPNRTAETCRQLMAAIGLPESTGNDLELLVGGSQFVPAMLESIAGAQRSILIEAFTLRRGTLALAFVNALAERATQGVDVRLVLDAVGSRFLPSRLLHQLRRSGVAVHFYGTLRWADPRQYLVRNHRKTFTIDRSLSFIGGMSIDDVFIGSDSQRAWHEVMLRVRGPLAVQVAATFDATYAELAGEPACARYDDEETTLDGAGAVLLASEPGVPYSRDAYIQLVRSAQRSIEITTPYFAPEATMLKELVGAAERGVHIRLITAGAHTNARIVRAIAQSYYPELLRVGVRIFEPAKRMTHAKTILVDKIAWIVGSTNIDTRSFYVNLEADILGCDSRVAADLSTIFALLEAESDEISKAENARAIRRLFAGGVRFLTRYV